MNRKLGWILVFSLGLAAAAHGQPSYGLDRSTRPVHLL